VEVVVEVQVLLQMVQEAVAVELEVIENPVEQHQVVMPYLH